jgi:predicted DNA-binding transcriptional regulator AlpA
MFTAKDLAARYRVSLRTIGYWIAKGILPEPMRIGGVVRWLEDDIKAWEASCRQRKSAPAAEASLVGSC